MMTRNALVSPGTPNDLIEATALGARLEVRHLRHSGLDDESVRNHVIKHYRHTLNPVDHDEHERETLMSTVQRSLDDLLTTPRRMTFPVS